MKKKYIFNIITAAIIFLFMSLMILNASYFLAARGYPLINRINYFFDNVLITRDPIEIKAYFQIIINNLLIFNILPQFKWALMYFGLITLFVFVLINPKKKLKLLYLLPVLSFISFFVISFIGSTSVRLLDLSSFITRFIHGLFISRNIKYIIMVSIFLSLETIQSFVSLALFICGFVMILVNIFLSSFNKKNIPWFIIAIIMSMGLALDLSNYWHNIFSAVNSTLNSSAPFYLYFILEIIGETFAKIFPLIEGILFVGLISLFCLTLKNKKETKKLVSCNE